MAHLVILRRTLILAALLSLAPTAASAQARAAPLRLTASPTSLRLAEGGRVLLRIAAEGEQPVLSTSVGRLEGLREVGSGIYEAEYIPPDSVDPAVAIVTATGPGSFGWIPIPLHGTREVVVTAPHRTLVTVTVGNETFGPLPADARGMAVLRVAVPPGVHFASSSRNRRHDLEVSERGYLHVALDRTSLEASGSGEVTVRTVVLDEEGAPRLKAPLTLVVSEGKLGRTTEVAPGVFESRWQLGPGALRPARITAKVAGPEGGTAAAFVTRTAGVPQGAELEVDRTTVVAGDGDELRVTGQVVDAAGHPTDAPARLVVSLGADEEARVLPDAVVEWLREGNVYTGRVQVPRQRDGQRELQVKLIGPSGIEATATVGLRSGPPRQLRFETPTSIVADGGAHELRVVMVDVYGNLAEGAGTPEVTAEVGKVGAPAERGPGVYQVDYHAPFAWEGGRDLVKAKLGELEGEEVIVLRSYGGSVVLAPKVGFTLGSGGLKSLTLAGELGLWRRSLGLVLEGRWFRFSREDQLSATTQLTSEASFLGADATLAWRGPALGGIVWLGAGGGLVFVSASATAPGLPETKASTTVPAAHAVLSWGRPAGPGIPFIEVRGGWQGDPGRGPVRGSLQTVTLNLGYRFNVL